MNASRGWSSSQARPDTQTLAGIFHHRTPTARSGPSMTFINFSKGFPHFFTLSSRTNFRLSQLLTASETCNSQASQGHIFLLK